MQKKAVIYIMLGILVAALVCVMVGLITYTVALNTSIPSEATNYSQLMSTRQTSMILGMIIMIVGVCFLVPPAIVLLILLIQFALSEKNNKNN